MDEKTSVSSIEELEEEGIFELDYEDLEGEENEIIEDEDVIKLVDVVDENTSEVDNDINQIQKLFDMEKETKSDTDDQAAEKLKKVLNAAFEDIGSGDKKTAKPLVEKEREEEEDLIDLDEVGIKEKEDVLGIEEGPKIPEIPEDAISEEPEQVSEKKEIQEIITTGAVELEEKEKIKAMETYQVDKEQVERIIKETVEKKLDEVVKKAIIEIAEKFLSQTIDTIKIKMIDGIKEK